MIEDYKEILNEARLSAFASCIYLAAVKTMPQELDYKILFLDDIFIGLDMGNRLPLLRIIRDEFADYQVFITTYDRSWFEMAKFHLGSSWHNVELYGMQDRLPSGVDVVRPLLVESESDFNRGCRYLHSVECPDYPAAANYFRKSLEALISKAFGQLMSTTGMDPIPTYALTKIMKRAIHWIDALKDIEGGTKGVPEILRELYGCLPALLHPMSHYAPHVIPYSGELLEVERLILKLKETLTALNITEHIKLLAGSGEEIFARLHDTSGWEYTYQVKLNDHLVAFPVADNRTAFTSCPCYISRMNGKNADGIVLKSMEITPSSNIYPSVSYGSLCEFVEKTISFLESPDQAENYHIGVRINRPADYIDAFPNIVQNIKELQNQK